jgi:sigma-B regulation protein RsbU (phosphoserine phosphatase)
VTNPAGARLTVHDSLGHRVIPIDKPLFTIGRRPGSDLVLTGTEVSRDHAEIASTGDRFLIRDRQSRYGTFVNGERVVERALAHRDQIECGQGGAALMFLVDGATHEDGRSGAPGELRQMAALLAALRAMGSERVLDEVLALVLDAAIDTTGAERGFIMLADRGGALEMSVARRAGHAALEPSGFKTSRKIPEEVFATGQAKVVADLLEGDLPEVHNQTVAFGIRHVLCVPLRLVRYVERSDAPSASGNIGVLYLDSRERGRLLSPSTPVALEALATEAATAIENARLYREAMEKAKLDQELRTASKIQQALLPAPSRTGTFYEAVGASVPCRAIGGDFFDYLDLANGVFGFALGDITGKGPSAALVTAVVQGIVASHADTAVGPAALIALVNRVLLSRHVETRFATIFLGALAPDGRLIYCNAAQNPPLLLSGGRPERLEIGGTLVGAFEDALYEQGERQLTPGDVIVLFSDGIIEALNAEGEEFGDERVRAAVEPRAALAPERILKALLDALEAFTRGVPQTDDLTAVVVRYSRGE